MSVHYLIPFAIDFKCFFFLAWPVATGRGWGRLRRLHRCRRSRHRRRNRNVIRFCFLFVFFVPFASGLLPFLEMESFEIHSINIYRTASFYLIQTIIFDTKKPANEFLKFFIGRFGVCDRCRARRNMREAAAISHNWMVSWIPFFSNSRRKTIAGTRVLSCFFPIFSQNRGM